MNMTSKIAPILKMALSENQVIYHRGGARSFETVFSPLRDSAYSAVEHKGVSSSLEKSTVPLTIIQEEPERESFKTYLHIRLKRCESELSDLTRKYRVSPVENFETVYKKGNIEEEGIWNNFFRRYHLDAEIESTRVALGVIL